MSTNIKTLVEKLNDHATQSLERAVSFCIESGHASVEVEHWLIVILQEPSPFAEALSQVNMSSTLLIDVARTNLDELDQSPINPPALSPLIIEWIHQAWLIASLEWQQGEIDLKSLLIALIKHRTLRHLMTSLHAGFAQIDIETLTLKLQTLTEKQDSIDAPITRKKQSALDAYAINLNQLASQGKLDAVIGRDQEIQQTLEVLARRRQNNVILTGDPGVGKTAIAEGLALQIVRKEVSASLHNVVIYSLDMGLLQAGASVKGEFEQRLKQLIADINASDDPIILFIDEAHTLIGAGGDAGQNDAANLLKPALARGELRCIAATTWSEYVKYFEKDPALTRRFQVVKVDEPSLEVCHTILRSLKSSLENHHGVVIDDSAIQAAVDLSHRYIQDRQLPDKAISVLDTACAKLSQQGASKPLALSIVEKTLQANELYSKQLQQALQFDSSTKSIIKSLREKQAVLDKRHSYLRGIWEKQLTLVDTIYELKESVDGHDIVKVNQQRKLIKGLINKLTRFSQSAISLQAFVDHASVASVVSSWSGIPVGRLMSQEIQSILSLKDKLSSCIIGQENAIQIVVDAIQTSSANLADSKKPKGVFLLAGPSGVGKTQTALSVAEQIYGSESNLTIINMSEYQEAHKVSLLLGSPPGYVGYGDGGVLTEAIRRKPYSLILLDEIEKAHPSVQDMFYQVFDKGMLKDGQGREINCCHAIFMLTTNAASQEIIDHSKNADLLDCITPSLEKIFKPAFLGRLTIIPYLPLQTCELKMIARLKLNKVIDRLLRTYAVTLFVDDSVYDFLVSQCGHINLGARQIDRVIEQKILPKLSELMLYQQLSKSKLSELWLTEENGVLSITEEVADEKPNKV